MGTPVFTEVKNSTHNVKLFNEISLYCKQLRTFETIAGVKQNKAIEATRNAYEILDTDPNRYRPSSESLRILILRHLPLYEVKDCC